MKPHIIPKVSVRIAAEIIFSDKSVKEIAQQIGIKPNVLSMIKNGTIRVPLERMAAIADALGVERK